MTTFQTTISEDVARCQQSFAFGERITITATVDGCIRAVTGVVVSMEVVDKNMPLWTVYIDEDA